jgi:ABC-type bacteriocin/lantibiotic exporter with double-glycine peptidase domain
MRALLQHLRAGREGLWALLLLVIASVSFASFLLPSSFKAVVDSLLPRGNAEQFHRFCAAMLVVVLLRSALNLMQDYLFLRTRQLIEDDLVRRYFDAVLSTPLQRWSSMNEAELVQRVALILTHFQSLLSDLVYYFAYAMCVSLSVTVVLTVIHPMFVAISAVFLLLHASNFVFHYRISRRFSTEYVASRGRLAALYRELIRGRTFVTLNGLQRPILDDLDRDHRALYQASFRRDLVESGLTLLQQLLHGLNYLALVVVGALAIFDGRMSAGSMGLSLLLIGFAYEPVYRLSKLTKSLSEMEAQFARVLPLLTPDSTAMVPPDAPDASSGSDEATHPLVSLELRGLGFERAGVELVRDANVLLRAGNVYVLSGASGCGKSTLLHLIAGFLPPTSGQILWNGRDAGSLSGQRRAALISYCSQTSLLLDGSAQDNITLFEVDPSPERVTRALHLAVAEDFMNPSRASVEQIENEGSYLSGGQKQRLHLARACYESAPLMLFDEPTANLDAATEELFLQRLVTQAPGRIILLVSHSLMARRYATAELRLAGGVLRIVE